MTDLGRLAEWFGDIAEPVFLGAPRALAMLLVFPMLPAKAFPLPVRNGVAIAMVLPAYPILMLAVPEAPKAVPAWLLFMLKEAAIGAAIGWIFGMVIWAVETVGALLEIQTGTATGGVFDPISNQQSSVYTHWLRDLALVTFLAVGGLLAMLQVLWRSYAVWPVVDALPRGPAEAWAGAVDASARLLSLSLSLGLPLVIALLLVELGLGLLNRSLPQLNVFSLSMPLKMLAATLGVAWILGYYVDLVATRAWQAMPIR